MAVNSTQAEVGWYKDIQRSRQIADEERQIEDLDRKMRLKKLIKQQDELERKKREEDALKLGKKPPVELPPSLKVR